MLRWARFFLGGELVGGRGEGDDLLASSPSAELARRIQRETHRLMAVLLVVAAVALVWMALVHYFGGASLWAGVLGWFLAMGIAGALIVFVFRRLRREQSRLLIALEVAARLSEGGELQGSWQGLLVCIAPAVRARGMALYLQGGASGQFALQATYGALAEASLPTTLTPLEGQPITGLSSPDPEVGNRLRQGLAEIGSFRGRMVVLPCLEKGMTPMGLLLASLGPGRVPATSRAVLGMLASLLGDRIARARFQRELVLMGITDPLTGLFNYRHFADVLHREFQRVRRYKSVLSLILIDVDNLKAVNDTYGHLQGDATLAGLARLIQAAARSSDVATRVGGDEFAILLPETGQEGALALAHRLHAQLEAYPLMTAQGSPLDLKISQGIAMLETGDATEYDFFDRADRALYAAKGSLEGRIEVA